MKFAAEKGVCRLQVLVDSKLLMDWADEKYHITNLALGPIMHSLGGKIPD